MFSQPTPRIINLGMPREVACASLRHLSTNSWFSRKLTGLIFGEKLKHMRRISLSLRLRSTEHPQIWSIYWNGKKLGETVPYPDHFGGERCLAPDYGAIAERHESFNAER